MTKAKVKKAIVKELKKKKQTAKANGDVDTAAKIEQGLEALTRRRCARDQVLHGVPPCAKTFVPMLAGSPRVTEHYCSSECALLVIAYREGWVPTRVVAAMTRLGSNSEPHKTVKAVQKEEGNDMATIKKQTSVVVLAGSRAADLKPGMKGVVLRETHDSTSAHRYYVVRFGEGDKARTRVVGGRFLKTEEEKEKKAS